MYLLIIESHDELMKAERLYLKFRYLMLKVAKEILKDNFLAEDAVNQSFVRIINNLHKIDENDFHKTQAFIVVICRRVSYDIYNEQIYLNSDDELIQEIPDETNTPLDIIVDDDNVNRIIKNIKSLKPIYQDVMLLKYFLDFNNFEISELLKITSETVRKRIERGKNQLYELLGKEGVL